MNKPTVSVIMATYNHANFVKQAIESVLFQENVDFEFLIADDGSQDATRDVVSTVTDPRIKFFPNTVNRGACIVTNELIEHSSGEFIALINSDDYWTSSDKLSYQVEIMRNNPELGACFGRAKFVDKEGKSIATLPFANVFNQENRTQGQWLRYFFDLGNCICHPTMLIRKSCYEELGMYDNRLRQLPDFDMWVRLIKHYNIFISEREMISFRQLPGENASSGTSANIRRIYNESYFILENFFDDVSSDILIDGFSDLFVDKKCQNEASLDIEKSLLYFGKNRWASHVYNHIGLKKIYSLLNNEKYRNLLINNYNIDDSAFHNMTTNICVFDTTDLTNQLSGARVSSLIVELRNRIRLRSFSSIKMIVNKFLRNFS
jgi:glycosyltransferase involved in cell wall biosynthesis